MKACFDTSVLVAALVQRHPRHAMAFPRWQEVHEGVVQGRLTTRGVAEPFATSTAPPLQSPLFPTDVQSLIESSVVKQFTLFALAAGDHREAIKLTTQRNLSSGAVYEALPIAGAREAARTALYTLNRKHFQALAPGDALIASPKRFQCGRASRHGKSTINSGATWSRMNSAFTLSK